MDEVNSYVNPITYLGLDERYKDKVKDRFTVGSKYDLEIISAYFIRYYKLSYNFSNETIPKILAVKNKPEYVNVRKWIGYFAYRTGKYSFQSMQAYFGLAGKKGNGMLLIVRQLEAELEINKRLQKEYQIHFKNLKELFITFKLSSTHK